MSDLGQHRGLSVKLMITRSLELFLSATSAGKYVASSDKSDCFEWNTLIESLEFVSAASSPAHWLQ